MKLIDMADAVAAAQQLLNEHPGLPAPLFEIDAYRVTVRLHGGFGDFEAWREALDLDDNEISLTAYLGGANLTAVTDIKGVPVTVMGYSSSLPQTAEAAA
ncbi:hypothetical protein [Streptomyces sp. SGAir0957]